MPSLSSRKNRRRRKQARKHKELEGLKHKLDRGPFRGQRLVVEPAGKERMSDVLTDFIEPYAELADTEEAYRKLMTLAVLAWNAALLPEEKQQEMIAKVLGSGLPGAPSNLKTGLRDFVNTLVARKKAYFSDNRRAILDFELKDTGQGYHLSVASTLGETFTP